MKNQKNDLPIATDALRASYGTAAILPIEFFKLHAEAMRDLIPAPPVRRFLSSGTTRADRSQSYFSQTGLDLYRTRSIAGFHGVMQHFFADPRAVPGLSLIPPVGEWPDSSLAQMVAWIGEEQELRYWDGVGALPMQPVWVFGTAFHFVNLADDGIRVRLPAGSVVIETGGTKGRSRSVTRAELYELISEHLGVPKNRIVSEYGMCELASQAYDFVGQPDGPEIPLDERWFRFPPHAPVQVRDRLSRARSSGEGTLVIDDQLRIDYPWPIRTEDMARVRADGAFQLLGRVPMSPLKGCSMLAEEIMEARREAAADTHSAATESAPTSHHVAGMPAHSHTTADAGRGARAIVVHRLAQALADDDEFWQLWENELGNAQAAAWLQRDWQQSLPASVDAWLEAAAVADHGAHRWLIIPPETHGFAWYYPAFLGAVLGYEMYLRVDPANALVAYVQRVLKPVFDLKIWALPQRIGADPLPPVDAVMVYGSDETIAALQAICPVPVQGFGSSIALSLVQDGDDPAKLWKDAFSLLQRGCMSSRIAFVLDAAALPQAEAVLGPLPLGLELALEHGAFNLRCQDITVPPRKTQGAPLLLFSDFDPNQRLADYLSDRPLSLPVVRVPQNLHAALSEWLPAQQNLPKIAVHGNPLGLDPNRFELVPPGEANAPVWNGRHQKRPLFEYNKQDEKAESKGQEI